jgi:hypothetical protein
MAVAGWPPVYRIQSDLTNVATEMKAPSGEFIYRPAWNLMSLAASRRTFCRSVTARTITPVLWAAPPRGIGQ